MYKLTFDIESASGIYYPYMDGWYITMIGLIHDRDGVTTEEVIWFDHSEKEPTENGLDLFRWYIESADILVAHNAKFDVSCLTYLGVDFKNKPLHCTQVVEYLLRGQDKRLKWGLNSVADYYGLEQKLDEVKELWDKGVETYDIPANLLEEYCLSDCRITADIYEKQVPQIADQEMTKLIELQNEFIYSLSTMELNGFKFDKDTADALIGEFSAEADYYTSRLCDIAGFEFNPGSSQQLSATLYGGLLKVSSTEWVMKEYKTVPYSTYKEVKITKETNVKGVGFKPLPNTKGASGYYKTDKDTIEKLSAKTDTLRQFKKMLISYSQAAKVVSTLQGKSGDAGLMNKIQPDGLIHVKLNQTIAATGRLTSSEPNGQNLPRGNTSPIKKCIVPTLDGIMQVDLSQVEWRIAAYLSNDKVMLHEINSGIDQHIAAVKEIMKMKYVDKKDPESKRNRDTAKVVNFRYIYGGSAWGYHLDVNMPPFGLKRYQEILNGLDAKYHGLKSWQDKNIKAVYEGNRLVMPTGRWFAIYKHKIKGEYKYKENQVKNYPVQGVAGGDILPLMCVIIRRAMLKRGMKSKMILTVHDSLVFDYTKDEHDELAALCYKVGSNLTKYVNGYYGINLSCKLEVEVESGPTYGDISYVPPEEVI